MSKVKKFLWIMFAFFTGGLLTLIIYGMGSDLLRVLPEWLTSFIVGLGFLVLAILVVLVFVTGISKIKELW